MKPGPVQTPMTDGLQHAAPFADPQQVARDIVRTLDRGSPDVLYRPGIWRYIMTAIKWVPEVIFKRLPLRSVPLVLRLRAPLPAVAQSPSPAWQWR